MVEEFPDLTMFERLAPVGHTGVSATLLAGFMGALPTIITVVGGLLGIAWFCICIFESRTFQHWLRNRRMVSQARRLAKLRAQETVTLAKIAALETVRAARVDARELVQTAKADAAKLVAHEATEAAAKLPPV